jgi:16S rRNA (cytidine1402-2'-O)-methyltransferase
VAAGRLLVVGTPIGNLGDLSPRAAEALRSADLVVAEDTRVAARLLQRVGVRAETISFTAHNAAARLPTLLARLAGGATLALTTDAGMPAVSDPGARLVAAARQAGAIVAVVPGPSAVAAAVAVAGVESPGFVFGGFLPARPAGRRSGALERLLAAAGSLGLALVLYEAPHRLQALLSSLAATAPGARVAVCRELTKLHEEVRVGTAAQLAADPPIARGELTLVISDVSDPGAGAPAVDWDAVARLAVGLGVPQRGVVELLRSGGLARREAYRLARTAADAAAAAARQAPPTCG